MANYKDVRLQRDAALMRVMELEEELEKMKVYPAKLSKEKVLEKHDKWLLRLMKKREHKLEDLEQFWLFRKLMFKHWNRFT